MTPILFALVIVELLFLLLLFFLANLTVRATLVSFLSTRTVRSVLLPFGVVIVALLASNMYVMSSNQERHISATSSTIKTQYRERMLEAQRDVYLCATILIATFVFERVFTVVSGKVELEKKKATLELKLGALEKQLLNNASFQHSTLAQQLKQDSAATPSNISSSSSSLASSSTSTSSSSTSSSNQDKQSKQDRQTDKELARGKEKECDENENEKEKEKVSELLDMSESSLRTQLDVLRRQAESQSKEYDRVLAENARLKEQIEDYILIASPPVKDAKKND